MSSVIVLDLDETLIYACSKQDAKCENDSTLWRALCTTAAQQCRALSPPLEFLQTDAYFIFLRPIVVEFLQYCRQHFGVFIIFTAGNQSHAQIIYKRLFQERAGVSVDFLLHRESCGKFGAATSENSEAKTLIPFQKNLCHLREYVDRNATPEQAAKIDWRDCIFIDDFSFHAVNNCGETLLVPKFDYPCLKQLLTTDNASVSTTALQEACSDDTLLGLTRFLHIKTRITPPVLWQQLDKRFALFQRVAQKYPCSVDKKEKTNGEPTTAS